MYVKHCKLGRNKQIELIKYFVSGTTARTAAELTGIHIVILPLGFSINYAKKLLVNSKTEVSNSAVILSSMKAILVVLEKAQEDVALLAKSLCSAF